MRAAFALALALPLTATRIRHDAMLARVLRECRA